MDGITWEEKYKPLAPTKQFIEIFGGAWQCNSEDGTLYWEDAQGNTIDMPEDENEFWTKVLQSIDKRKNLFK